MNVPEGLGQQEVTGTRNQTIDAMYGGNAIGNVEGNVTVEAAQRMTSLFQLPLNVDDFTGREAELAEIYAALAEVGESGAVLTLTVTGMAGVGKSALAICAAHRTIEQFPDAQLYVDLQGTDAQPKDPSVVLAEWLRILGMNDVEVPLELDERVICYRSRLANKRVLVLLDNAHDEAQVRPLLLDGASCRVMVTSRRSLSVLAGAREIALKTLLPADAVALLAKLADIARVEAERQAAEEIVRLCGYLPIAIRIAGGVLRRPAKRLGNLADYAAELRDEWARLNRLELSGRKDVRVSFNLSYRQLSKAEQRLFGLLGLLAADFGVLLAAAVGEVRAEEAEEIVERLTDAQLIEVVQSGRYRYHDWMRLYAQELWPDDRLAVQERAFHWYWGGANHYENAFDPQRRGQVAAQIDSEATAEVRETAFYQAALVWFEVERTHLLTAFKWGYQQKRYAEIVSFAKNLEPFFQARSYWRDWEDTHLLALAAAKESKSREGESQTLHNLGLVYQLQGRWDDAIAQYEQSLEIKRSLGNRLGQGQSLVNLGLIYQSQSHWDDAVTQYEQSLEIFRSLGNRHKQGQSLIGLGNVYKSQSRWDEAITYYEQGLEIFRSLGDHHGQGQSLIGLGNIYQLQSRWDDAIAHYEQSLKIFRSLGDRQGEGQTLNNLGVVYQLQSRWNDAITHYEQSLEIKRSLGDRQGEGRTSLSLGGMYGSQGRWNDATAYYEQSLEIYRNLGDQQGEG